MAFPVLQHGTDQPQKPKKRALNSTTPPVLISKMFVLWHRQDFSCAGDVLEIGDLIFAVNNVAGTDKQLVEELLDRQPMEELCGNHPSAIAWLERLRRDH
eukprot:6003719-Amphidinium_carterae.1